MNAYALLATATVAALVATMLAVAARPRVEPSGPARWWSPLVPLGPFLVLSLLAVGREGPLGFWANHTQNLWGTQVWADLLISIGICWLLLVPRLRRHGGSPWPWLVLVVATGSIGMLGLLARVAYLEATRGATMRESRQPVPRSA